MDSYQKEHIRKNLTSLLETTDCNVSILAYLKSKEHLSDYDIQDINGIIGNLNKASKLYEIMQKRENGYEDLIGALNCTKQSKAHSTLMKGSHAKIIPEKIPHLVSEGITNIAYNPNDLLGCGRFGTNFYKGTFSKLWDVAIKKINLEYNDREDVLHEIGLLYKLGKHETFLQYFGAESTDDCIFIAVDLCKTPLCNWVKDKPFQAYPSAILSQITSGISHLHSHNIIHRNLTPDNVLLSKNSSTGSVCVKITGLALSIELPVRDCRFNIPRCSDMWSAPEVLEYFKEEAVNHFAYLSRLVQESDIFSLGCIYYYTLTNGKHPFGDLIRGPGNILDGRSSINLQDIKGSIPDYHWLIQLMIGKNIASRPNASFLLNTPIFWSNEKLWNFISAICGLRKVCGSKRDLEKTWVKVDKWGKEVGLISDTHNSWIKLLCEDRKVRAADKRYNKASIKGLLKFIVETISKGSSSVDEWITYFTSRFRYLITILWISFQCHKQAQCLSSFYCLKNELSTEKVKAMTLSLHLDSTPYEVPSEFCATALVNSKVPKKPMPFTESQESTINHQEILNDDTKDDCSNKSNATTSKANEINPPKATSSNASISSSCDYSSSELDNDLSRNGDKKGISNEFTTDNNPDFENYQEILFTCEVSVIENVQPVGQNEYSLDHGHSQDQDHVDKESGGLNEGDKLESPTSKKKPSKFFTKVTSVLKIGSKDKFETSDKSKRHSNEKEVVASSSNTKASVFGIFRKKTQQPTATTIARATEPVQVKRGDVQMEMIKIASDNRHEILKNLYLTVNYAQFEKIDNKINLRWVNYNLKSDNIKLSNLPTEFKDGGVFLKLVSKLGSVNCGEPNKTKMKFSMMDNFRRGFDHLKAKFGFKQRKLERFVDGDPEEIETLVWELMQTFHLQEFSAIFDKKSPYHKAARNLLLQWCQEKTKGYDNVNITDFEESWKTGLPLCALVHSCFPDLFDYDQLTAKDGPNNLQIALGIAEKEFGIPCLFDATDVSILTERAVICQMMYFYKQFTKMGPRSQNFNRASSIQYG